MSMPAFFVLSAAALLFAATVATAGKTSFEELCRLRGNGGTEDIRAIGTAYADALDAGIPYEELHPFVDEILRRNLDCRQMFKVLSAATALRKANLPHSAVFCKVREGVAKGAPPALVVEAAQAKLRVLTSARDVLNSLASSGYLVTDFRSAAVIVSSYIEKGYAPEEVVHGIRSKGLEESGFAALVGMLEKRSRGDGR